MNKNDIAVIMAGGSSTLLKSANSPVLAKVLGQPMIQSVTEAALLSGIERLAIIVPSGDTQIRSLIKKEFPDADIEFFEQSVPLGTAHAVLAAQEAIETSKDGNVLILNGDTPFIDASTINSAYVLHTAMENDATVITATVTKPFGYGRILRDANEHFSGIVEEADADSSTKKITEISSGTYWFKSDVLLKALHNLSPRANGHFNLVDVISNVIRSGMKANTFFPPIPILFSVPTTANSLWSLTNTQKCRLYSTIFRQALKSRILTALLLKRASKSERTPAFYPAQ